VDALVKVVAIVQVDAVLGMVSVPAGIDDHYAGNLMCKKGAPFAFENEQGEVDARGDAGAGENIAFLYEEGVVQDLDSGKCFSHLGYLTPMGSAFAAVQQARFRQDEGSQANGADQDIVPGLLPEPGVKWLPLLQGPPEQELAVEPGDEQVVAFPEGYSGIMFQAAKAKAGGVCGLFFQ